MFEFNNKVNKEREVRKERNALKAQQSRFEKWCKWCNSEEHKRMYHLKTLIIKTYGTVNIKMDNEYDRLDESFTRADYVEDFAIFFDPKVFDKLKDWCREYEILREKEDEIIKDEINR